MPRLRPSHLRTIEKFILRQWSNVRINFYEIDDKVLFGEMTFTPGAGNFYYKSEGTDEYLSSLLKLPELTPPPGL